MPSQQQVFRWLAQDEAAAESYARAIQRRSLTKAEEIEELTKKVASGEMPPDVGRVVIDAHKWIASRLMPKIYGERQEVSVSHTHTHVLHLEALKEMADRGRARQDAQAIDVTPYPTLEHKVLDVSPALPASPEPRPERRPRATPPAPAPTPPGPALAPSPTRDKKIRTPKNLKRAEPK